jgi:hypothetical protein
MQTKKRTETKVSNKKIVVLLFAVRATLLPANAQTSDEREKSNELGLVVGATVTPSQTVGEGYFGHSADIDLQLKSRAGRGIQSPLEHQ